MSYSILWFSHIAYSLFLVTLISAVAARCKKPLWRKFWPIFTACVVFIPIIGVGIGGFYFITANIQPKWLFWFGLSETIVYIPSVIVILVRGLKGTTSGSHPARQWSRTVLGLGFGCAVVIYAITLNMADIRILAHLASTRGEAATQIAYLLPARLPDHTNSYPIYEKAVAELGPRTDLPDWFNRSREPGFDIASQEVRAFLEKHQNTLAIIHHAASMTGYNLEVDISNFFNYPIPQYSNYQNFARLLSLSARSKARAGDMADVAQDLGAIEKMAEHLYGYPILISVLAASALETIQYETLENILSGESRPINHFMNIPIRAHPSIRGHFTRALHMEAYAGLHLLVSVSLSTDIFKTDDPRWDSSTLPTTMRSELPTIWWRVFILPSEIRAAKDIITREMTKPVESYKALEEHLNAIYDAAESGKMSIFTGISAPSYGAYVSRAMSRDAMKGLYDLALALTSYQTITGRYPNHLEDLVPKYIDRIPVDPFDDTPLKMKSISGGLDLYSIGPEQKTDSGKTREAIHFYLGREAYDTFRRKTE
ncbi:MAG: hypothetical protein JW932_10185 [Deltaproteobacteria bacterium]|nr:hypothetical protein [Deltaproteobacteria bacterium]